MCIAALGVIGAVVSAAGSIVQGVQANQMAQYQAKAQEQQARADAQASAFEAAQERRKQELLQANARAQIGASGVAFEGSPATVLSANAAQNELDLMAIRYGSTLRQNNMRTQAAITRYQGKQARTAGFIGGVSNLFSGLSAVRFGQSPFA